MRQEKRRAWEDSRPGFEKYEGGAIWSDSPQLSQEAHLHDSAVVVEQHGGEISVGVAGDAFR